MRFSLFVWFLCLTLGWSTQRLQAQDVALYWSADTNSISLGEPIRATLTLRQPANLRASWPLVADSLLPLDVLRIGEIDSVADEEGLQIRQTFQVTAFDSGRYQLPPIRLSYLVVGESQTRTAQAQSVPISVFSIPIDTTAGPKALAPVQQEPITLKEVGAWGGTLLLLAALGFGIWYVLKNREKPEIIESKPAPPPVPPYEIAMRELAKVEAEKYWQKGDVKTYYSALTDVIRVYVEQTFRVSAMESVTDEIVRDLEQQSLPDRVLWPLKDLLRDADLAKFAKFNPSDQANLQAIDVARTFVKQTKNWLKRETEMETPVPESQPVESKEA